VERILVVGDAHGNSAFMEKQIRRAGDRGISTLLQLGDFGVWPGRGGDTYLDAISAAAVLHDVDVRFIDGNHEDFFQLNGWLLEPERRTAEGFVQLRERLCWIP
jgi:predicted phosphodiesterase